MSLGDHDSSPIVNRLPAAKQRLLGGVDEGGWGLPWKLRGGKGVGACRPAGRESVDHESARPTALGRARAVDGSWSTHKVQPFRSRIFRSTSRSATGGRTPPGGWSGRGRAGGGGRPTRFDRVVFFRRGASIRDSFASFHSIAARSDMRAAAPRQRVHARHTRRKSSDVIIASVPADGAFSTTDAAVWPGRNFPRSIEAVAPPGRDDGAAGVDPEQVPCTHRWGCPYLAKPGCGLESINKPENNPRLTFDAPVLRNPHAGCALKVIARTDIQFTRTVEGPRSCLGL